MLADDINYFKENGGSEEASYQSLLAKDLNEYKYDLLVNTLLKERLEDPLERRATTKLVAKEL